MADTNTTSNNNSSSETPFQELSSLLEQLETDIVTARRDYRQKRIDQERKVLAATRKSQGSPARLTKYVNPFRKRDTPTATATATATTPPPPPTTTTTPTPTAASFVEMPTSCVENLRRIAELVVIGEKRVAAAQMKKDDSSNAEEHAYIFDLFFEQNTLQTIVDMLLGNAFDVILHDEQDKAADSPSKKNEPEIQLEPDSKTLLPPISVATQAIQSISILVQNVSRASSLYILLSSNNINKMIALPLDCYAMAERERQVIKNHTAQTFASPPMTELTTHFVSFLKSLALRMNTQTLQFFLKFPSDVQENGDVSENTADENQTGSDDEMKQLRTQKLEFPLYERALDFCAAHQDSFVRVTAMNICLNTLRLTTVWESGETDSEKDIPPTITSSTASPTGALHTAKPLPFRERFLIAQFACIPSRVERLISPLFTKLAERWNALDEQIREIDANKSQVASNTFDVRGSKSEKIARVKEQVRRERLLRAFQDKAADLQDVLLLLDDVFRVGLTVLNEQMIEMMFATFVYPLLLQPLLLYHQRLSPALAQTRSSFSDHPFGGYSGDIKRVEEMVVSASGPAKTALFTIASAFHFLTNRALLRLLFTALFHPLSPDSTSVPTVRSRLEVSMVDCHGRRTIRLDPAQSDGESGLIPDERTSYEFGTDARNRRRSKTRLSPEEEEDANCEKCVFVLAPALAEVLEYKGEDFSLVTRAKPNPYRQALLSCLGAPDDFFDTRNLAVCVFDSALRLFEGKFVSQIMYGLDLKRFEDDVPQDERNLDSSIAHASDDRGMGGSVEYESRHSLSRKIGQSVGSDLVADVVTSLCACVVFASSVGENDEWEVGYSDSAAHALLCAVRSHPRAMIVASKTIESRSREARSLVTARVSSILSPMGGSSIVIRGSPSINDPRYDEKIFNAILDIILYGSLEYSDTRPAACDLFHLSDGSQESNDVGEYYIDVAKKHSFKDLCAQVGSFLAAGKDDGVTRSKEYAILKSKREGFCCLFRADALYSLLRDLSATAGLAIRDKQLAGLIVMNDGFSRRMEMLNVDMARTMYCGLSKKASDGFFAMTPSDVLEPGMILDLASKPIVPCVSQVPPAFAHLFAGAGAVVETEDVTWQSLCLFVDGDSIVFAQPLPEESTGTAGRVVTCCPVERVWVEQDSAADPASPARRLILSHSWISTYSPPLFLFDAIPEPEAMGPFTKPHIWTSHLDIWFEDQEAAGNAFLILISEIFNSKSIRGQRIQEVLSIL